MVWPRSAEDIMKLFSLLLPLALAIAPTMALGRPLDQHDGWRPYTIAEAGTYVEIPTGIFSRDAGPAQTGSGRRFLTSDGRANLTVQSVPIEAGYSPGAFLARMQPPPGIVYKRVTPRFFVVSSFRDNIIWYNRCNFSGGFAHCILLNYPADEKQQWDDVVTRISSTLASR
jgi:hypothetical protein